MSTPETIQIFKPGRHTAMSGAVLDFSAADLRACAAAYDPAKHEAPLVVGHPRLDAPAYGWVKSLAYADALEASPDQVDPAFAEMVGAGRFKKISASFFAPDAANNPVPGVYYLRHIGFLGAQPPAVKGLRTPSFAAAEDGVIEFGDWGDVQNAGMWRRLRDFFIAQFGLDKADSVIPDYAVASLESEARSETTPAASAAPMYAAPTPEDTVNPEQAAALAAENEALKRELADAAARDQAASAAAKAAADAARHAEHLAYAEALVAEGKLTPAQQAVGVALLDHLAGQPQPVEFGEGDAKAPLADAVKALLSALPVQIAFGQHATNDRAGGGGATADFAAPAGHTVDGDRAALHRKALDYQAANPGTEYLAAVKAVS